MIASGRISSTRVDVSGEDGRIKEMRKCRNSVSVFWYLCQIQLSVPGNYIHGCLPIHVTWSAMLKGTPQSESSVVDEGNAYSIDGVWTPGAEIGGYCWTWCKSCD